MLSLFTYTFTIFLYQPLKLNFELNTAIFYLFDQKCLTFLEESIRYRSMMWCGLNLK